MPDDGMNVSEIGVPERTARVQIKRVKGVTVADKPRVPHPLVGQSKSHVSSLCGAAVFRALTPKTADLLAK